MMLDFRHVCTWHRLIGEWHRWHRQMTSHSNTHSSHHRYPATVFGHVSWLMAQRLEPIGHAILTTDPPIPYIPIPRGVQCGTFPVHRHSFLSSPLVVPILNGTDTSTSPSHDCSATILGGAPYPKVYDNGTVQDTTATVYGMTNDGDGFLME